MKINDQLSIRMTEPHERDMFQYSYSIMEAILTCPVYGLIRYYKRKYYPTKRQLPLEAGSTMHDVFAAVRVWQLFRKQGLKEHFMFHGRRLFNTTETPTRFENSWKELKGNERDELLSFCYKILNSSDYYDDPDDRVRTIANMEETTTRYVDEMLERMDANPIWVADLDDPTAPVGIEIPFDMVVTYKGRSVRYIGTIDGIVTQLKFPGTAMLDENKTASRLDEAFRESFEVKQQPNAYILFAKMISGLDIFKARILGVKLKQTRSSEDFLPFIVEREEHQMVAWARSLFFCSEIVDRYGDDPLDAPQFTHSCNRYFRACSFVSLCAADPEDARDIYENSMVEAPLTPSQMAVNELSTTGST